MPVTATRAFLRFLVGQGLVGDGIAGAVPTVRTWKHASLPHYISTEQVTRTIVGCSAVTPVGLRDRAILAVLAGFGVRACELAALRLDDIHWREAWSWCVARSRAARECYP
jgi:site-specific recombinase XerC